MIRLIFRQFYPALIMMGFAAYGYGGDGLNDGLSNGLSSITISEVYAQVSDMAPKLTDTFSALPRL